MLSANETIKTPRERKPSTQPHIERENCGLFWDVVQKYQRLGFSEPLVSSNPNPTGRKKKRTATVAEFGIDVESAAQCALQGTGLFDDWNRLAKDNLQPVPEVMRKIIGLCTPVYRERGLQPDRYFNASGRTVKQPRSVHHTRAKSSVRNYSSHHRYGVLEKNTRVFCKEHGLQDVRDFFKHPDGNKMLLGCGCDRREDIAVSVPVRGSVVSIAALPELIGTAA